MPRLYIGRLNQRVTERDLKKFFDGYGKIRDVMMKNGYAFMDFEDYRDADDAVYDLNGKELLGDRVILEHAKGVERGVGGLPYRGGGSSYGGGGGGDRGGYGGDRGGGDRGGIGGGGGAIAVRKQRARENPSFFKKKNFANRYGPPIRTKWQLRIENLSSRVSWQCSMIDCRC